MPRKSRRLSESPGRQRQLFDYFLGRQQLCLGSETKLMGVLNVTPDSFSDGGAFFDPGRAAEQALRMEREGAHLLDIGGESSRPGAAPVPAKEEIRRIRPVLRRLVRQVRIPISVDTYKSEVARMALDEGAVLINDIYALRADRRLGRLIARYKAGVVLMHMQGTPRTMQTNPRYREVAGDILRFLRESVDRALTAGIERSRIAVDPGFGFGKTAGQNIELLRSLDRFQTLKLPLLVGLSRKSFIGHALDAPVQDRLFGSLGAAAVAIERGAHILRVHDVLAHRHMARLVDRSICANGT